MTFITVKAHNFDRVFTKNIFFLNISSRWLPCDRANQVYEMPKSKFWLCTPESPHKIFSESVEVTSCASNFDRYIYLLNIMPSREQRWKDRHIVLFIKQCGTYIKVLLPKKMNKNFSRVSIIFLYIKNQKIKNLFFHYVSFLFTNSLKNVKYRQVLP